MKRDSSHTMAKRAANVSVRCDLLDAARAADINLSATLETALEEKLRLQAQQKWRRENHAAIANYNEHVIQNGVFSDEHRSF